VARRFVLSRNPENEEAKARYWSMKNTSQWVVTPGKQTNKQTKYTYENLSFIAVS
jgi:preprotein translocase subunit Sec63